MIEEKNHWATITDADLKNAVSLIPDKDFMNTDELKEYEKNQILDIANNNCIANYINTGKKSSSNVCVNGAVIHFIRKSDLVIIVAYC